MTAKELYKKLSRNKTSEELFNLDEQPEKTCPMIDSTISDIRSFRGQLGTLKFKLKEYLEVSPFNCHRSENLVFFNEINEIIDTLNNWDKGYISLEKELEVLRSYLESIRSSAAAKKDALWVSIDLNIDIDEKEQVIIKINKSWPSAGFMKTRNDNSNVDIKIQKIKDLAPISFITNYPACEECLLLNLKNEILDLINNLDPNIFLDHPLDELINKTYLEEWVNSVVELHISDAGDYFLDFMKNQGYEIR